jgi:Rps23 Pro-64 3,4-dihydroxylase Tpa1-like proline 4-hydroxylase
MPQLALKPAPAAAPATRFKINPDLDVPALAEAYARDGRVRVWSLLSEGAEYLHDHLDSSPHWIKLIKQDEGVLGLNAETRAQLSADEWAEIEADVHRRARFDFQYRYDGIRVPEREQLQDREASPITEFAQLMQSTEMLDLLEAITGQRGGFTDGFATAYGPGDFLTGHDDDVAGKNRLAAYVYGLTKGWRIEWGGLLLFHGPHERTVEGLAPRFNTLDLFSVPRQHSVTLVTPAAPHRRYTVTGWLRGGTEGN